MSYSLDLPIRTTRWSHILNLNAKRPTRVSRKAFDVVFIGVASRIKSLFRPEKPAGDHPRKSFAVEKSNGRRNRPGKNLSTFGLGQFPPRRTAIASYGVHSSQMLFRP